MRPVIVAALAASGALAACSLVVSLDGQQCSVDSDCTSRGGAFSNSVCQNQVCIASAALEASVEAGRGLPDGSTFDAQPDVDASPETDDAQPDAGPNPWGCLSAPPEVLSAGQSIAVTLTAFDALQPIQTAGPAGSDLVPVSYTAVPFANVEGCNTLDPACNSAVASGTMDEAGVTVLTMPANFVGFFRLTAPGYFPSTTYPGQLLADASAESITTAMVDVNALQELAFALNVNVEGADAGVGLAFFEAFDCFDHHAPGVTFTILGDAGAGAIPWYIVNGVPSTADNQTGSLGAGGAVNVPAGPLTVVATLASTKQVLGTISAIVREGETVFGYVRVRTH